MHLEFLFPSLLFLTVVNATNLTSGRPLPINRNFNSTIIESVIKETKALITDPVFAVTFENCFPNTLDTTVEYTVDPKTGNHDTFVITGDIPAMWQRDSSNQVYPYVQFALRDQNLQNMLLGVINRQKKNVLIDAYPNAFNKEETGSPWDSDSTTKIVNGTPVDAMQKIIWERKYEIDSIANVLRLATEYYFQTRDPSFLDEGWFTALQRILQLVDEQTLGTSDEDNLGYPAYTFSRSSNQATETTIHGRGSPSKKCGLVKSYFRPSDDACLLPFNIPGNALLSVVLERTAKMLEDQHLAQELSKECRSKSQTIRNAIYKYGIVRNAEEQRVFAYEIDGFGSYYLMDDANIPSLLSLPLIGFIDKKDPIYQSTRRQVLSENNPYYYKGKAGSGIGGPHNGDGWIWPMAIIVQALTSDNDSEIIDCLRQLLTTTADTNFMHESFWRDDSTSFTRTWFAWANTLFGELVITIRKERPHILKEFHL